MKTKMRKELRIGLIAFVLFLILNRFFNMPEVVMGILMGLGISLLIVGSLSKGSYQKLRNWKKSLVK